MSQNVLMDTPFGPLPGTLSVEDAGELLGLPRSSAYRNVKSLPVVRIGNRLRVSTPALMEMLATAGKGNGSASGKEVI